MLSKQLCAALFVLLSSTFGAANLHADTLADIYELALHNDPTLQAAEATYKAGREIKSQALAQLLPQISAAASYRDTDESSKSLRFFSANQPFPSNFDTQDETKSYSVSLTQNIFNLQAFFAFKQSRALSEQAELQFGIDQQNLILRSAEAYFNILRGKDNLASAIAEERAISRQLEQTQQRYDVGLIAITDVYEARAAFDLAVVNRLTEEVKLGTAREDLNALTNIQHGELAELAENFPVVAPEPASPEQWVSFTETNNLTLKLAAQVAEASQQNAKVKKSAHLPSIQGTFSYRDSSTDTSQTDNNTGAPLPDSFSDVDGTTLEIRAEMPLFMGGQKHSERRQAGYERVRDHARHIEAKRTAIKTARSSYLTTLTDVARVNARKVAITSAQSALDATQAGYDAGTRNIVDLLNAQRDLFRAQRDYANSRYDYVLNMLTLKETAGTLSPQEIYDLDRWLTQPTATLKSAQDTERLNSTALDTAHSLQGS